MVGPSSPAGADPCVSDDERRRKDKTSKKGGDAMPMMQSTPTKSAVPPFSPQVVAAMFKVLIDEISP